MSISNSKDWSGHNLPGVERIYYTDNNNNNNNNTETLEEGHGHTKTFQYRAIEFEQLNQH